MGRWTWWIYAADPLFVPLAWWRCLRRSTSKDRCSGATDGELEGSGLLAGGSGHPLRTWIRQHHRSAITTDVVRQAGRSWSSSLKCTDGELSTWMRTSSAQADTIGHAFKGYAVYDNGLPVVFRWPRVGEKPAGIARYVRTQRPPSAERPMHRKQSHFVGRFPGDILAGPSSRARRV
jgi:hypothetical protein